MKCEQNDCRLSKKAGQTMSSLEGGIYLGRRGTDESKSICQTERETACMAFGTSVLYCYGKNFLVDISAQLLHFLGQRGRSICPS